MQYTEEDDAAYRGLLLDDQVLAQTDTLQETEQADPCINIEQSA